MTRRVAALAALLSWAPAWAQPAPPAQSQAYYEFLIARRLEAAGDPSGALAALQRARKLDPASAGLRAELAGFQARQNRAEAAVAEAEEALKLDAKSAEAHHVLGQIYSAWADGASPPPSGTTPGAARRKAIEHLSALAGSPLMATDPNLQMTLGRHQLRDGRAAEAIPVLERVAAQVPWTGEPLALLAEARIAAGQLAEAVQALEAAAEISPRYYVNLAGLHERQGRWADAAGAYGKAAQALRSPSRDLRVRWATALINVPGGAGAAKAREILNDLLGTDPGDARVLYLLASAERAGGNLEAAEATARRLLDSDPDNVAGLRALAATLADRFEYRRMVQVLSPFARQAASRAKGREAEAAMVLAQLGLAHQQLGAFDAAIDAFTQARGLAPRDVGFDVYLVQGLIAARRFDRAEALAAESLARSPDEGRMVGLRAQALAKSGRPADALRLAEAGAAAHPGSRDFVVALADLYVELRRSDAALRVLDEARRAFPDDVSMGMRVAAAHEAGGRLDLAEREFRRLLAEDPLNATAMNSLAYMLAEHGLRLPEAVTLAERAVRIEPANPAYLDTLAWALFKAGRAAEAASPMERAATTLAGSSVIQDHHGDVLAATGRLSEAVAAWERAIAGDGADADLQAIRKKIDAARVRRR